MPDILASPTVEGVKLSQRALDALLVVLVAAAMTLVIATADEPGSREPDALGYALGLAVALTLLGRRRWPMGVLIASTGLLFIYYGLAFPAFSPAVPLAVAAYSAALAGHVVPAGALLGGVLLFSTGYQTVGEGRSLGTVLADDSIADAALMAAVLLLGEAVRNRRAWAGAVRARTQAEADRRVEEERLRMARELHDVVAHTIAGLNVQASVASDLMDDDPEQAKAALRTIRAQSREAIAELRATVGVLRGDGAPHAPAPGLAALESLVRTTTSAGVDVAVEVDGPVRPLPNAIDLTAYRIVQESLTNVVRHARASAARVLVRFEPGEVVVQVSDDGAGANGRDAAGHGLLGMRERAAALGGTLAAGPAPGGGFTVRASLPTRREDALIADGGT